MATKNQLGWIVYVEDALPATNNAAGFEALVWTKCNGLISATGLGMDHDVTNIPDVETGIREPVKDAAQGRAIEMAFKGPPSGDAGRTLLKTLSDDREGKCSLKFLRLQPGASAPATGDTVEYAQGVIYSSKPNDKSEGQFEGVSFTFQQSLPEVLDDQPA